MVRLDLITKTDLIEVLQPITERLDGIEKQLDSIEGDIREIKSGISRIDANIEIMTTSQGYSYSKEQRIVKRFGQKAG